MNINYDNMQPIKRVGIHHTFDADLAVELKSIDLAVLVHHFQFWIRHNAALNTHFHDERTWTYQSLQDIAAHFPYWSVDQVKRLIVKLVDAKILRKGNYNNSAYDRTVWYAFEDEEKFSIWRNRQMEMAKQPNGNGGIAEPIPDASNKKKKKKRDASLPSIEFDYESNEFANITDADKAEWLAIYAGIDIDLELKKMRQWLMDPNNPERDGNRTFITNWLSKAQKQSSKAPRKPTQTAADEGPKNANGDNIPYNSSIAYGILHRDGEEKYVEYLKKVNEQKYYNNFLNGKYEPHYVSYLEEQGNE